MDLGTLIVTLGANVGPMDVGVKQAEKSLTKFRAMTSKVSSDISQVTRTMGKVGLVIGGVGAAAIKMAADFDKGVREIGTLVGGLTDNQLAKMKQELMDVSETTGQALNKLTKARYDIVSAGFTKAADSATLLTVAAKSAVAGVTDVATTADVLTTAINAYDLKASDAMRVSDTLFKTVQLGKTTMGELAGTLGRAIPLAAELGVNIDELGASVAVLTKRGQQTDLAITALRSTYAQLLKPTESLQKVLEHLGFDNAKQLIAQRGFQKGMEDIASGAKGLGLDLADVFANIRAMQAAFPLAGNASDDLAQAMVEMGHKTGVTEDAFNQMNQSLSVQFAKTMNKLKNILINLGEDLMPTVKVALNDIGKALKDNADAIDHFVGQVGSIIQWAIKHGDALAKIFVVATISKLTLKFAGFVSQLNLVSAAILGVGTALGVAFIEATRQADRIAANFNDRLETLAEQAGTTLKGLTQFQDQYENFVDIYNKMGPEAAQNFLYELAKQGPKNMKDVIGSAQITTQQLAKLNDIMAHQGVDAAKAYAKNLGLATDKLNGLKIASDYVIAENIPIPKAQDMNIYQGVPSFQNDAQDIADWMEAVYTWNELIKTYKNISPKSDKILPDPKMLKNLEDHLSIITHNTQAAVNAFSNLGSVIINALGNGQNVGKALLKTLISMVAQATALAVAFGAIQLVPGIGTALSLGQFLMKNMFGIISAQSGADFVSKQPGMLMYHPNEHVQVTPSSGTRGTSGSDQELLTEIRMLRAAIGGMGGGRMQINIGHLEGDYDYLRNVLIPELEKLQKEGLVSGS